MNRPPPPAGDPSVASPSRLSLSSPEAVRVETQLLAAIAGGDRAALRELYQRYGRPLFALAQRFVGDAGAAEEIVQDTLVKIWRQAGRYDGLKSRPFTWAVTILRRTAIDHQRRRGHPPVITALEPEQAADDTALDSATGRQAAETHENAERLQAALAKLPPPQRTAVELALFSTLTHAEIAARLGHPLGSIKTWIRRGLLDLRATLKESAL